MTADLVALRELHQQMLQRLDPGERRLAELRSQGLEWAEIAAEVGGTPGALRKKLERARHRIEEELGLAEDDDE